MERTEALRRVLFLKHLSPPVIETLARAGHERCLNPCETLFHESAPCIGLLVVLSGAVKVFKLDSRGREITLGVERAGASIGDLALFDGGNYPASAEACADGTRVYIVPRARWDGMLRQHPEIATGAVRALAVGQRKLIEMLKAQALHTVRARLAAYLLSASGEQRTFSLGETNAVIGSHVGTVREVVSRTLHGLEDAGAIRLHGRTVTVLDADLLRRLSEQVD